MKNKVPKKKNRSTKRPHPRSRTLRRISADTSARNSKKRAKTAKLRPPATAKHPWWYIPPEICDAFLEDLANGMYHEQALTKHKLQWRRVSTLSVHDEAFKTAYAAARDDGDKYRDMVRFERADRRAVHGWLEPVYQQGSMVGVVRRYSDRLMEIQLKAADPKRYAERHEVSGPDGGPIVQQMVGGPERPKTIADWEAQRRAAEKAEKAGGA